MHRAHARPLRGAAAVDEGRIREEASMTHPERNRLLQCLGGFQPPRPRCRLEHARSQKDDIVLLCSDGLWAPLTQRQMLNALLSRKLKEAVPELVSLAEARAGRNATMSRSRHELGRGDEGAGRRARAETLPYYELPTDVQDMTATDPDFLRVPTTTSTRRSPRSRRRCARTALRADEGDR